MQRMDSRNSGQKVCSTLFNWLFPKPAEKLRASTKSTVTGMETWTQGTDSEVFTKGNIWWNLVTPKKRRWGVRKSYGYWLYFWLGQLERWLCWDGKYKRNRNGRTGSGVHSAHQIQWLKDIQVELSNGLLGTCGVTIATDLPRMIFVYGNCPRKKNNSTGFQSPQMFQVVSINSVVTLVIMAWNFRPLFNLEIRLYVSSVHGSRIMQMEILIEPEKYQQQEKGGRGRPLKEENSWKYLESQKENFKNKSTPEKKGMFVQVILSRQQ